jgi:hypothetical protein
MRAHAGACTYLQPRTPCSAPSDSLDYVPPQIEGTDEAYCKCTAGFMGPDCTAAYMECDKGLVCYNGGQCTNGDSPDTQTCGCPREYGGLFYRPGAAEAAM